MYHKYSMKCYMWLYITYIWIPCGCIWINYKDGPIILALGNVWGSSIDTWMGLFICIVVYIKWIDYCISISITGGHFIYINTIWLSWYYHMSSDINDIIIRFLPTLRWPVLTSFPTQEALGQRQTCILFQLHGVRHFFHPK